MKYIKYFCDFSPSTSKKISRQNSQPIWSEFPLTIEKCKGGVVPVAVWSVNEEDEAALDRYEGFPDFYYKKEFRIKMKGVNEKAVKAFAYIMHEDRPFGIPTLFYMNICRNGYDSFKFNQKYLIDAYEKSREEILK